MIGNGIGTIVIASSEKEVDGAILRQALAIREGLQESGRT
jgi:hypothetical protein